MRIEPIDVPGDYGHPGQRGIWVGAIKRGAAQCALLSTLSLSWLFM
jgi:hypothetical protein